MLILALLALDEDCLLLVSLACADRCSCRLFVDAWLRSLGSLGKCSCSGDPIKRVKGSFAFPALDAFSSLDAAGFANGLTSLEKSATKNFFSVCGNLFKSLLYLKRLTFFT